jgi:hypothetical protein
MYKERIARNSHGLVRIAAIRGSAIHARARVITAEVSIHDWNAHFVVNSRYTFAVDDSRTMMPKSTS